MHHAPALFLHPSRRLRALALTVHAEILPAEPLRTQILFHLREVASAEQVECVLGSWCMAARDAERHVALVAQRSWDAHVLLPFASAPSPSPDADRDSNASADRLVLDDTQMAALLAFAQRALIDPLALHAYLNPVQVPVDVVVPRTVRGRPVPPPVATVAAQMRKAGEENGASARARGGESEEESEADRKARLRIGALGALQWVLGACTLLTSDALFCWGGSRATHVQIFALRDVGTSCPKVYSRFYLTRGCGALFVMSRRVRLRRSRALDMRSPAFEVMPGRCSSRCLRTGQVRHQPTGPYYN